MSRLLIHLYVELTDEERQALELAHGSGQKAYGEMIDWVAQVCLERATPQDIALAEEI